MPIVGDATVVIARLDRAASNALRVQLTTPGDTELAHAQQKGGLAVLLGFNNGGKSNYTLCTPVGDELLITVGKSTTVTRQNTPIGKILANNELPPGLPRADIHLWLGNAAKMVMRGLEDGDGDLTRYRSIRRRFVAPAFASSNAPASA
jgi:hypothetical protein